MPQTSPVPMNHWHKFMLLPFAPLPPQGRIVFGRNGPIRSAVDDPGNPLQTSTGQAADFIDIVIEATDEYPQVSLVACFLCQDLTCKPLLGYAILRLKK